MLPPLDEEGSIFRWHSFRIVNRMYKKWEALAQQAEAGELGGNVRLQRGTPLVDNPDGWEWELDPKASVEDNYIPQPRPRPKGKSGRSGKDMP